MYGKFWPIKINFGQPNAENCWKIAHGRLLFLALLVNNFKQYLPKSLKSSHVNLFDDMCGCLTGSKVSHTKEL